MYLFSCKSFSEALKVFGGSIFSPFTESHQGIRTNIYSCYCLDFTGSIVLSSLPRRKGNVYWSISFFDCACLDFTSISRCKIFWYFLFSIGLICCPWLNILFVDMWMNCIYSFPWNLGYPAPLNENLKTSIHSFRVSGVLGHVLFLDFCLWYC